MSAPDARTSSGRIALTVAAVPTGMKAGVRISPRSIAIVPVRETPSVAEIEKEKRVTGAFASVEHRRYDGCQPKSRLPDRRMESSLRNAGADSALDTQG